MEIDVKRAVLDENTIPELRLTIGRREVIV